VHPLAKLQLTNKEFDMTEALNAYETVYIAQASLDEESLKALNERFAQTIGAFGGQITATEPWGRRTLAYPIKKQFEGQYILQRFQMRPEGASEVDRFFRLNENIIRYLIVRTDE